MCCPEIDPHRRASFWSMKSAVAVQAKRAAALVVRLDELLDASDEIADAAEASTANRLLRDQPEPGVPPG